MPNRQTKLEQLHHRKSVLLNQISVHTQNLKSIIELQKNEIELIDKYMKEIESFAAELLNLENSSPTKDVLIINSMSRPESVIF